MAIAKLSRDAHGEVDKLVARSSARLADAAAGHDTPVASLRARRNLEGHGAIERGNDDLCAQDGLRHGEAHLRKTRGRGESGVSGGARAVFRQVGGDGRRARRQVVTWVPGAGCRAQGAGVPPQSKDGDEGCSSTGREPSR